ncbi:gustatory and odorant receptor 24 [Anabrus simplex]|uniref:gustatory and odorant receptor 24 n=1 Tax=Anabrus simplex TaxID=316456 RepID=UPI0035A312F0
MPRRHLSCTTSCSLSSSYTNYSVDFQYACQRKVLFKKCTRQELNLGLNRISKIFAIICIILTILYPIYFTVYRDLWKHIFILLLTLIHTAGSTTCFISLWCINCMALARAGQRLADNFEEYSRNVITPHRLYEYRMAWRKLSSLCDELGDVFSLVLWILNMHAFLGFTLAGYATVFYVRRLKLRPLAITLYSNLQYGVVMFILFDFPGRVPNSITGGMMRELNKISPLSVNEQTWREVETFIRVIGDNKAEIHANGFFVLNRQLYVSFISTVVTYLLVMVQVEQDTWYQEE